jgi:hypothetical protein
MECSVTEGVGSSKTAVSLLESLLASDLVSGFSAPAAGESAWSETASVMASRRLSRPGEIGLFFNAIL